MAKQDVYLQGENIPTFYVNSVQVAYSPFDVRMMMGTIEDADEAKVTTKVSVKIYMSFAHAKIFSTLLQTQLAKIEATLGPIQLPEINAIPHEEEG